MVLTSLAEQEGGKVGGRRGWESCPQAGKTESVARCPDSEASVLSRQASSVSHERNGVWACQTCKYLMVSVNPGWGDHPVHTLPLPHLLQLLPVRIPTLILQPRSATLVVLVYVFLYVNSSVCIYLHRWHCEVSFCFWLLFPA